MGFPSYQEDNQDAASEPETAEKTGVKAIDMAELDEEDELDELMESDPVKNTVIVKADGFAINSADIESYTLDITFMDEDNQLEPQIELTATPRDGGKAVSLISKFYDIKKACSLLTALMEAIENQEAVFIVKPTV